MNSNIKNNLLFDNLIVLTQLTGKNGIINLSFKNDHDCRGYSFTSNQNIFCRTNHFDKRRNQYPKPNPFQFL